MSFCKVNKTTGELEQCAGLVDSDVLNGMSAAFPSTASSSNKLATMEDIDSNSPLPITFTAVDSLPVTYPDSGSDTKITSDMIVEGYNIFLSNPAVQTSDWTVSTANGSVTISGAISGATDIAFNLVHPQ